MHGMGRSDHRLVIVRRRDSGAPAVLLLKDGDVPTLPRVELPEQRSADIADLNRPVRSSLGLDTSVLQCLVDEPGAEGEPRRHLQVLEAHGDAGALDAHARWMTTDAARAALGP